MVHDIHPAVFGGEDEESHESVEDVIKVVFLVDPPVAWVLQTVRLAGDVLLGHVRAVAVEEKALEQLKPKLGIAMV